MGNWVSLALQLNVYPLEWRREGFNLLAIKGFFCYINIIVKTIVKNLLIVFIILLVISGIFTLYSSPFESKETIPLNQVVNYINNDEVVKITVQ